MERSTSRVADEGSPSNACPNFKHVFETEFGQKLLKIGRIPAGSEDFSEAFQRLGRHFSRICHDVTGIAASAAGYRRRALRAACRHALASLHRMRISLNPRSHDPACAVRLTPKVL